MEHDAELLDSFVCDRLQGGVRFCRSQQGSWCQTGKVTLQCSVQCRSLFLGKDRTDFFRYCCRGQFCPHAALGVALQPSTGRVYTDVFHKGIIGAGRQNGSVAADGNGTVTAAVPVQKDLIFRLGMQVAVVHACHGEFGDGTVDVYRQAGAVLQCLLQHRKCRTAGVRCTAAHHFKSGGHDAHADAQQVFVGQAAVLEHFFQCGSQQFRQCFRCHVGFVRDRPLVQRRRVQAGQTNGNFFFVHIDADRELVGFVDVQQDLPSALSHLGIGVDRLFAHFL